MGDRFDVVVIGAGSAGAVVAARLSERPGCSVLLLEAGPDLRPETMPQELSGSDFNAAKALRDRTWPGVTAVRSPGAAAAPYTRGRGVGGSSVINAMIAIPGEPADYDEWEATYGCAGWSWREVKPWFDRIPIPLHPAPRDAWGSVSAAFAAACPEAIAAPLTRDAAGRRASVNEVYLEPARRRANLVVRPDALVDRVLLRGRSICGVLLADGTEIEAGTVVVSAGAIHSPAILMRSGIERAGIGQNLHDHVAFPIAIELDEGHVSSPGSLAISVMARGSSQFAQNDLQLLAMDHVDPAYPRLGLLMAALMRVHSRGTVRLAGPGADVEPIVEFASLTDPRDLPALRAGVEWARRVLAARPMRAIGSVVPFDDSDDGLRLALGDYVHACGSCRMGAIDDQMAVVDPAARVIGYEGLLVIDASIIPNAPRANTHLPVVMIAEKLAASLELRR